MKVRVKKSIRQYINCLHEPAKSEAFSNASNDLELLVYTLDEALSNAFTWEFTPQGHEYWSKIANP